MRKQRLLLTGVILIAAIITASCATTTYKPFTPEITEMTPAEADAKLVDILCKVIEDDARILNVLDATINAEHFAAYIKSGELVFDSSVDLTDEYGDRIKYFKFKDQEGNIAGIIELKLTEDTPVLYKTEEVWEEHEDGERFIHAGVELLSSFVQVAANIYDFIERQDDSPSYGASFGENGENLYQLRNISYSYFRSENKELIGDFISAIAGSLGVEAQEYVEED